MNNHGWGNEPGDNNKGPRKPADGPPDLEELWRDFSQRLGGMFGKKPRPGNNGGFNGGTPNLTPRQFGGGMGVTLLPKIAAEAGAAAGAHVAVRQFAEPIVGRSIGVAWREGSQREDEARLLASVLRELF